MQRTLHIEYGDDVLLGVALSPEDFQSKAKFLLAAKLYELGKLTSGQAASLCGKGRYDFLMGLPRAGVPVSNMRPDDAELELAFAHRT